MRIFFDVNVTLPFRDVFLIFLDDLQTLSACNKLRLSFSRSLRILFVQMARTCGLFVAFWSLP